MYNLCPNALYKFMFRSVRLVAPAKQIAVPFTKHLNLTEFHMSFTRSHMRFNIVLPFVNNRSSIKYARDSAHPDPSAWVRPGTSNVFPRILVRALAPVRVLALILLHLLMWTLFLQTELALWHSHD